MTEQRKKLLMIATHAEENPDKATLPFVMGNAALAMGTDAVIILQTTAVYLAMQGYADHVHASGFPALNELLEAFFEGGGKLMVCSPCIQARKIEPENLIPEATVIAGATLISESLSADSVLNY
jgi:predicted peroxiredoxin